MHFKGKFALIALGIILLSAGILAIRQKFYPTAVASSNFNINDGEAEFNKKMVDVVKNLENFYAEEEAVNININKNINANKVKKSAVQDITDKFLVPLYDKASVEKELIYYSEQKITAASLASLDEEAKVIEYYKQQLGDQAKEVQEVNEEAADNTGTGLILFTGEGGEGELSVKIWRDKDKTNIDLSISDNFKDPRQ